MTAAHEAGANTATFTKTASFGDNLPGEAAALAWLAEAEDKGGIHIVRVFSVDEHHITEERVIPGTPNAAAARRIGAGLARMHAEGAPWLGCAPTGWTGDPWVGRARTPYLMDPPEHVVSWGEFFAEHRIDTYVRQLVDRGDFGRTETRVFDRVKARLVRGDFDSPQPLLVRTSNVACARLHGDLWAGNVLWDGNPAAATGGALIDPMAYGGHAETDLAMLALFGYPFLEEVIAGYQDVSPLADGWRDRVGLHQLAPLLLHCVLFGGWYLSQTLAIARRYA